MKDFPLVKCPYCFEQIRYNDAVYRCTAGLRTIDMYLKTYHRDNGNYAYEKMDYPVVDPADLQAGKISCDEEGYIIGVENPDPTSRMMLDKRLCPYCHNDLSVNFGKCPTKYIAVVGVPNSGKTTYLAAVNDRMNYKEWNWISLSGINAPLNDVTSLYRNNRSEAHVATRSIQGPYLYGLNYTPNDETQQSVDTHIVLFDIPGEFYTNADKLSESLKNFLSKADGIIFIVNAAEEKEHNNIIKKSGATDLVRVTNILDAFAQAGIAKNKKSIILFNKIDLIEDELGINDITKRDLFPEATDSVIEPETIERLSNFTKTAILVDKQHGNATTEALKQYMVKLQQTFGKDSKVFATRLLIPDPINPDKLVFNSVGAETPFLWLLSEIGAFPVKIENKK